MREQGLGPNGALLFCMEHLQRNIGWLHERLKPIVVRAASAVSPYSACLCVLSRLGGRPPPPGDRLLTA